MVDLSSTSCAGEGAGGGVRGWRGPALLLVALAAFYGAMQNGLWRPGTDSQVYLTLARNLATGRGYTFNNLPVEKVPPGWPIVLAGAMRVTPAFAVLNLITPACMLAAAAIWYRILTRFVRPGRALAVTALAGTLFGWYQFTLDFLSDGPFTLAAAGSLLLAVQVAEGRKGAWRVPLLALLCAAAICVRWTGALTAVVACGVLLTRWGAESSEVGVQSSVRRRPRWAVVGVVAIVAAGTFLGLRAMLEREKERHLRAHPVAIENLQRVEQMLTSEYSVRPLNEGPETYLRRLGDAGTWVATLFWRPAELRTASRALGWGVNAVGWGMLGVMGAFVVRRARRGEWVWVALVAACGALVLQRARPVARYLVPVAPLLLLAAWVGLEELAATARRAGVRRVLRWGSMAFVGSIALTNAVLWAVDVRVTWAADFYDAHEAGEARDLMAAARLVRETGSPAVVVDDTSTNLGRTRPSQYAFRVMVFLGGGTVRVAPNDVGADELAGWMRSEGALYYLRRLEANPWRLWHFRVPWLQQRLTRKPPGAPTPSFELYELSAAPGGGLVRVALPPRTAERWPRVVPGMGAAEVP